MQALNRSSVLRELGLGKITQVLLSDSKCLLCTSEHQCKSGLGVVSWANPSVQTLSIFSLRPRAFFSELTSQHDNENLFCFIRKSNKGPRHQTNRRSFHVWKVDCSNIYLHSLFSREKKKHLPLQEG